MPLLRELVERFVRENRGNRDHTVHALFNFITMEMVSDPGTWTMPPEEIRRRVCACVDEVLEAQVLLTTRFKPGRRVLRRLVDQRQRSGKAR
jgi:hypothetical protein